MKVESLILTTRIIIARHGNTFQKEETPTRVGRRTDLALVEKRRSQAIGEYIKDQQLTISAVYSGPLKRHMQTARLACEKISFDSEKIIVHHDFNEIDYGPDENQAENEVMLRLGGGSLEKGRHIIELWNSRAIVPQGWLVEPTDIIQHWLQFGKKVELSHQNQNILLISSNGIIRFAPHLTQNAEAFSSERNLKVMTGAICIFEKEKSEKFWRCREWNITSTKHIKE